MLQTLTRLDEADGSRRGVPNWLSTHPAPADRVEKVQAYIAQSGVAVGTAGASQSAGAAEFLRHVDGIVYGDSPRQGIVRGNAFLHPELRLSIEFPRGWEIQNAPSQVVAKAPERNDFMLLQLVPNPSGSLEQVAQGSMANAGFRQLNGDRAQVNGMDAYVGTYQGQMQGLGSVVTLAAHVVHNRSVYLLAGIAPPNEFESVQRQFSESIRSFRELSAQEAANIRPNRVDLYTVRSGDTWESIVRRSGQAGGIKASTLAIMNDYEPGRQPRPGDRIKIVVEG
jgi:predicted Zn-dependent protease